MYRLFLVDDWPDTLALMARELETNGFRVETFTSGISVLERLRSDHPDLLLIDVNMPEMSGLDVLVELPSVAPDVPAILMTGVEENLTEVTVRAMKLHAVDFIEKSAPIEKILDKIREVVERHDSLLHDRYTCEQMLEKFGFIGSGPAMQKLCLMIERVADSPHPVFLIGETGTGKELAARAIHRLSNRRDEVFLAINCGAIVDTLAESELFGHVKGAFTGADAAREGLFSIAEKGTLFLDEISEANSTIQVKLLRALDPGEFTPIGGMPRKVKTRIICSSNRLLKHGETDSLRRDLFFRLEAGTIYIPPLRDRKEDIPLLARFFFDEERRFNPDEPPFDITHDALDLLSMMRWEGNVRELRGFIRRLRLSVSDDAIKPEHVSEASRERYLVGEQTESEDSIRNFIAAHRSFILREGVEAFITTFRAELFRFFLSEASGNKAEAARLLKMDPSTFRKALERLG
ncbi:MAG: sigma-54-dependent Fis family transcriptional regulator, partial [Chlorobi bacterium]|nr:sigma-54-dependent Fis family transcriptional regulator [Chlorobiota bacterium]